MIRLVCVWNRLYRTLPCKLGHSESPPLFGLENTCEILDLLLHVHSPVLCTDLIIIEGVFAFKCAGTSSFTGSSDDFITVERIDPLKSIETSLTRTKNVTAVLIYRERSNGLGIVFGTSDFKSISMMVHSLSGHEGVDCTKSCDCHECHEIMHMLRGKEHTLSSSRYIFLRTPSQTVFMQHWTNLF